MRIRARKSYLGDLLADAVFTRWMPGDILSSDKEQNGGF
jgi:hypothetical protein